LQEKNHPEGPSLRKLYAHVFDRKRAHATTTVKMDTWMDLLEEVKDKLNPAQIISFDEAQLTGKGADETKKRSKSIGVKGMPAAVLRSIFSEHTTLVSAMTLSGLVAPPFVIFTGKVVANPLFCAAQALAIIIIIIIIIPNDLVANVFIYTSVLHQRRRPQQGATWQ
jgi:hypothetical protein